jgi:hypothetical protein
MLPGIFLYGETLLDLSPLTYRTPKKRPAAHPRGEPLAIL